MITYKSENDARGATDEFYENQSGFSYTQQTVATWLDIYLRKNPPLNAQILDICCGDGVWSKGFKSRLENCSVYGIDISTGGINKARDLNPEDHNNFIQGDAELELSWENGTFDLIFARGPGLFNQHSMDRQATINVIERWHTKLKKSGIMISSFYSDPDLFGTYTNPVKVSLPYNKAPRLTDTVDFTGGKYHHDIQSFLLPFKKAQNVKILDYRFIRNNHIIETQLC